MIYNVQAHLNTRWRLVNDRDGCCARFGNKLNKEVCRVFPIWRLISGFGRHSEKFSRICACIRRNFTPCHLKSCNFYVFQISWTCCRPLSLCKSFWRSKWESYRYLATISVSVGDFSPKICKMAYHGKTTLGLNSIVSICFIKSTITIFIFSGHKCFWDKISWHNIHWATSKEVWRNGVEKVNCNSLQ